MLKIGYQDPTAPKRPMSAFLYFSQDKRRAIKEEYPGIKNTEVSKMLGAMWRKASTEDRQPFIEKELFERNKYKTAMTKWKRDDAMRQENLKLQTAQHQQQMQKQPEVDAASIPEPIRSPPHEQPMHHLSQGESPQYTYYYPQYQLPPPSMSYGPYGALPTHQSHPSYINQPDPYNVFHCHNQVSYPPIPLHDGQHSNAVVNRDFDQNPSQPT